MRETAQRTTRVAGDSTVASSLSTGTIPDGHDDNAPACKSRRRVFSDIREFLGGRGPGKKGHLEKGISYHVVT
ncbi:unnamed protein product [Sphagnum troendelagicum]|uniref:Uncharacterized protein n=1 Tax=Sphagnum jensenii TaxID=128206 RepID=A0ABP0WKU2_9BRYO